MHLHNVTLELSTKPFYDESEQLLYAVSRHLFTQWKDLTDAADVVTVMLWIADGSEIFDYSGNLDQTFQWASWCGCANHMPQNPKATERERWNTHFWPVPYRKDIRPKSYRWLKKLVQVLKETGRDITGKSIRVGETYDNGPEFAISDFKYKLHPEICQSHTMFANSVVTCTATLHADNRHYAAFPQGIPQGTSVGTFLGSQFRELARDMDFDFLWLSNGMGFGTETWGITGMLFDKHRFHPEKATEAADLMLAFWHDFFQAYPGCVIETRGSNFSAGLEIATDACPLKELYGHYKIAPPVNSPWAALNFNTGLELAAWMSHVAELPDERFPFRFYIHDPWFMNSPWLDRYGREPWDLFQPLAISRIDDQGNTVTPNSIAFLSADNTWGDMPDQVPREVIPLIYDAMDNAPDAPGPLVWIYPFDEYSELVRGSNPRPDIVFSEDFYLGECLQSGLPLNTVVSTRIFRKLSAENSAILDQSVLVVPVSAATEETIPALQKHLERQGKIIFYGSQNGASPWLSDLLGMVSQPPLTGAVDICSSLPEDRCAHQNWPTRAYVHPQHTCGGLSEALRPELQARARAYARQEQEQRVIATMQTLPAGGQVAFARCLLPAAQKVTDDKSFNYATPAECYPVTAIMRKLLAELGWKIRVSTHALSSLPPRTCISRHDNAFFFTIYAPDTTADMAVNTPYGAPLLTEMNTYINEDGDAVWRPDRCWRKECRAFVTQHTPAVITNSIEIQRYPQYTLWDARKITGLVDADLRYFVPRGTKDKVDVTILPPEVTWTDNILGQQPLQDLCWESTENGDCLVLRHISGTVNIRFLN